MRFKLVSMTLVLALGAVPTAAQVEQGAKNVPEFSPAFENQTRAPDIGKGEQFAVEYIVRGLERPWGIAVLPDGRYLVTERPGRLRLIAPGDGVETVRGTPRVVAERQGGLLDVALAEDFEASRRIFLTYSKPVGGRQATTAAATAILEENPARLADFRDIFVQTPASGSRIHFGSRIVVDGDVAYVTVGDRGAEEEAQNLRAANGKVVRITLDGGIPADNPFRGQSGALGEIWTYGHRNPQGAALDPRTGELWTLEHGPAGGDELNRIERGTNYGWPVVSYGENYNGRPVGQGIPRRQGMQEPRYYWDPVIAPGDFTFYQGDMFDWQGDVIAGSLNPGGIVRLTLAGDRVTGEARYLGNLGRIRDVEVDRDGSLLLAAESEGALVRVTPR